MDFPTQYTPRLRISAPTGSNVRLTYEPYYDEHGVLDLKESGKIDSYLEIQSHADSVDINLLLARYNAGEADVLNQVQGFYADVTGMPQTYAGLLNTLIKGEQTFNALPLDVRAKFNHSFAQFISEFGSDEFNQKINEKSTEVDMSLVEDIQKDQKEVNTVES